MISFCFFFFGSFFFNLLSILNLLLLDLLLVRNRAVFLSLVSLKKLFHQTNN